MNANPDRNNPPTTFANLRVALGVGVAMILMGSTSPAVLASDASGDTLSPGEIFRKAQEKYASLTSYSDEGKTVATVNGMTITTAFSIRLARPNLYRIEWDQNNDVDPR